MPHWFWAPFLGFVAWFPAVLRGVHWGHKEAEYDPSEECPGTAPFRYCTLWHCILWYCMQVVSVAGAGWVGAARRRTREPMECPSTAA